MAKRDREFYKNYLKTLSNDQLYKLLYDKNKEYYDHQISDDFVNKFADSGTYKEQREAEWVKAQDALNAVKGNKEAMMQAISGYAVSPKINFQLPEEDLLAAQVGDQEFDLEEEAYIPDISFDTMEVQQDILNKGLANTKTEPALTGTYADRKAVARESQTDYLDKLFAKYSKITAQQGVTSSAANLMNTMASVFATKKALGALDEADDIRVPGKDVVRLRRPDVRTEFDIYANRLVNTGLKQARELGRPELIPSILYQGIQVGQKGILEQGKSDTQISNQQAMIDLQIVDAFKGRQMQAEGVEFQTEAQKANARAGLYSQFGQYLKQSFSAQADIMNKTLINPISTSLDWFDRYGYQEEGIFNTSTG